MRQNEEISASCQTCSEIGRNFTNVSRDRDGLQAVLFNMPESGRKTF
jgi:hypothetical protein